MNSLFFNFFRLKNYSYEFKKIIYFIKVFNYLHYLSRNPPQIFWLIFFSSRIKNNIYIYMLFYTFIQMYSVTLFVWVEKLPVSSFSSFFLSAQSCQLGYLESVSHFPTVYVVIWYRSCQMEQLQGHWFC